MSTLAASITHAAADAKAAHKICSMLATPYNKGQIVQSALIGSIHRCSLEINAHPLWIL
jgi:hypothetical protein